MMASTSALLASFNMLNYAARLPILIAELGRSECGWLRPFVLKASRSLGETRLAARC